jgi:hypothetical protein
MIYSQLLDQTTSREIEIGIHGSVEKGGREEGSSIQYYQYCTRVKRERSVIYTGQGGEKKA